MKSTEKNTDIEGLRAKVAANDLSALKQLADHGYVGASNIEEFPDFFEIKKLLSDLQNEFDTLTLQHRDIAEQLRFGDFKAEQAGDAADQARRLVSGQPLAQKVGEVFEGLRAKELQLRERLASIDPVLRVLPTKLERISPQLK